MHVCVFFILSNRFSMKHMPESKPTVLDQSIRLLVCPLYGMYSTCSTYTQAPDLRLKRAYDHWPTGPRSLGCLNRATRYLTSVFFGVCVRVRMRGYELTIKRSIHHWMIDDRSSSDPSSQDNSWSINTSMANKKKDKKKIITNSIVLLFLNK